MASSLTKSGVFVEVLLPKYWWQPTLYQLKAPITCAGHTVPAGFVSDGATVSRWFAIVGLACLLIAHFTNPFVYAIGLLGVITPALFPRIGNYIKAALVHDYYLECGIQRKKADLIFKHCLQELGIEPWRAASMFYAVRFYGIVFTHLKNLSYTFK